MPAISDRSAAPTERQSLAIVAGAHVVLLAALSLALRSVPPPPVAEEAVAIEVVSAADAGAPTAPKPAPKAVEAPPPPPAPDPAPPEPVPEPTPEPVKPTPPKPDKPVVAAEADKPKPAKIKPDKAKPDKPVDKPAPQRLDTDALSSLLDKSVRKAKPKPLDTAALAKAIGPVRPASKFDPAALAKALGPTAPRATRATPGQLAAIAAAIKAQVQPCWNPPLGGTGRMTVLLHLDIARDGSVARPSVVGQTGVTAANGDYARTFAETARRAVLRCAPLKLPADSFDLWKAVEINFDPSEL